MEDIRNLTDPANLLQISNGLQKLAKNIYKQKIDENIAETSIKEIDLLKELCQSDNIQMGLLACQTLVHLAEDGVLPAAKVLTIFVSMLSGASGVQISSITEGIISLLLIDLRHRIEQSSAGAPYKCPFGLKPPQHPLIIVLQKKGANINDISIKIKSICSHYDKRICDNSIEFLRPVFLYVLCNPNVITDSNPIWNCLLGQSLFSTKAMDLLFEIFNWCRYDSSAACLHINMLLNDAIDFMLNSKQTAAAFDLQMHQVALLKDLVNFGYDPRPSLNVLLRTLKQITIDDPKKSTAFHNYLLILLADLSHIVSPVYLVDILRILKFIIETQKQGNAITLNMVLDALIIRLANATNFLSSESRAVCENLIRTIVSLERQRSVPFTPSITDTPEYNCSWNKTAKYPHPDIAFAYNLAILSEQLLLYHQNCGIQNSNLTKFVLQLQKSDEIHLKVQLFLRALLLLPASLVEHNLWLDIWKILMNIVKNNVSVSIDMIYFVLYLLGREERGEKQLAILKGLAEFASVKENIPLILNIYRALSASSSIALQTLAIDLHVRLWKNENRTYQFLHKMLSNDFKINRKADAWEMNIVKAKSIKEICELKPSQHGKDLVVQLSDILNYCSDDKNDLATSLTLEAIILLCNSHTVNIASTWKALGGKFSNEKRLRSIKSLCKFFGEVPLLQSPTADYENLFYESLQQLWVYVTDHDARDVIEPALTALKNFNISELSLKHIPALYQENLIIPSEYQKQIAASAKDEDSERVLTPADVVPYIPGECWLQLLDKVNQSAVDTAVNLIHYYTECEISQYRSGVYMVTGGRTEPNELSQLHARSPLRAFTKYLVAQSKFNNPEKVHVLINCLKCVSRKYSKPIPPFDWFFLLDLLDKKFDEEEYPYQIRIYCLTIAANQVAHSGSARNLMENYLQQFRPDHRFNEEIKCLLELVPQICNGIGTDILQNFLNETTDYAYEQSKSSHFESDCLLGVVFTALAPIFKEKCLVPENVNVIVQLFRKYYEILDTKSKFFLAFAKTLIELPSDELLTLTTPDKWTIDSYQKTAVVRCILCEAGKATPNDKNFLLWLNAIVDNATEESQRNFVTRNIFKMLTGKAGSSNRYVCEWVVSIMEKIQSSLTSDETFVKTSKSRFLLEIFMVSISIASGFKIFSNKAPIAKEHTIDLFPEALLFLSTQNWWRNFIIRIFEFINYLLTTEGVFTNDVYDSLRNTLICCKNNEYFLQKTNWTKYIGLKLN